MENREIGHVEIKILNTDGHPLAKIDADSASSGLYHYREALKRIANKKRSVRGLYITDFAPEEE